MGVVFAVALGLDQLTKWLVQSTMELGETIPVIDPILSWHYILNPGAAFSIGTNITWVFTLFQAAVVVYIAVIASRVRYTPWALALGGVAGGAAGNLVDRLFREPSFGMGHVVDFIAVPKFAVFNIADSFVVCSMIAACLLIFRGVNLDGRRPDAEEARSTDDEAA
ncbi:signal peptidase II [Zhihengliuella halotolerans]|uniref:Lipoprotein signal peptidase n=1 Tax=Zhihengliuella halotolerans TaxID=370736 RepID=A0A4Q8AAH3_9MICC|nr:signal peptidase II [Zhihengliuella halotolerans]RZU61112.1 signal peptidase II [Zhihengliuella halotolerans]